MRTTSSGGNWVVSGDYVIELVRDEYGALLDAHTDKPLPNSCQQLPITDADWTEIVIMFTSRGYYDPGCMYLRNGDPGYPPEGGDERTFDEAWLWFYALIDNKCKLIKKEKIEQSIGEELFDSYWPAIMDVELEFQEEDDRDE